MRTPTKPRWKTFLSELTRFFHILAKDIITLFPTPSEPFPLLSLSPEGVKKFPFPEEIKPILDIAQKYFGNPDEYPVNPYALLLAIRVAERGRKGFEFGITMVKDTDLKTQCEYACRTLKNTFERFKHQTQEHDFITFLGSRYAPLNAPNDPEN
ncbi:MAG: hypothetical protein HPY68_11325, partial [Candidatus Atribacteria bacterium]|nr:hypothetical protein [Candidatus Atribacteria bacterium]